MARSKSSDQDLSISPSGSICLIAAGTSLEGNIFSNEQVRFDGKLVGELTCGQKLVIGKKAEINGSVKARHAVIMGQVIGNVHAEESIQILSGAVVKGKLVGPNLVIEEGATFEGESRT